jgi:creatinine amidohydrolase
MNLKGTIAAMSSALLLTSGCGGLGGPTASSEKVVVANTRSYPTMLDMTFPEFETAIAKTDAMLLPVGAIEAHGPHLPLNTDASGAVAQLSDVREKLRLEGYETILGPLLNIGITNEAGDRARDGTYMYPGSLTIRFETFVALYVDLLQSLRDSGVRRVFLYSGHLGGRHLEAVIAAAQEASSKIDGLEAYALIDTERLERLKVKSDGHILPIKNGLNFPMLTDLLGKGVEPAYSTHADGWETSLMLYFRPDVVRSGYERLPQSPSSRFFEAAVSGDRSKNPSAMGGFPTDKASAASGKTIADYRTARISDAILEILRRDKR